MTPKELFDEFVKGFPARKFSAGLLVAMIDFLTDLCAIGAGYASYNALLKAFPRQTKTSAGKSANTLIVQKPDGKTLSLRPFYNAAETFYRSEHKRFDYPSAAPHATQAWPDYTHWIDALVTFAPKQVEALRADVNDFVLTTLKSQEFDPSSVDLDPPLFKLLLEAFEMTARNGEPTGASYQGIVFGFLRADNPHLQIEIDKVRTGSKRLQRIGDVDGWEGGRLAISAEVKQFELADKDIPDFQDFANRTGVRGALGLVCALGFKGDAYESLEGMNLIPLDVEEMLHIVRLWDPIKQRVAVQSFVYYAAHVEKNSSLSDRIASFLEAAEEDWTKARKAGTKRTTAAKIAPNT